MEKRLINDPLYDMIHVPPLCAAFMDTRLFQRLRNIKQLGLTYYVFPSATHTRFQHCLGACHLAQLVCERLKAHMTQREADLVCLAAMWHDVGHMAFSHLYDELREESHEERSIWALRSANQRLGLLGETEVEMVADMILGRHEEKKKPFLYQIVSNDGVDVDRLDYLKRDAYYTGHPQVRAQYIIECMRVQDGHLVFVEKAQCEIKSMFNMRDTMFETVYHHKTCVKMNELMKQFIQNEGTLDNWTTVTDSVVLAKYEFELDKRDFSAIKTKKPKVKKASMEDVRFYKPHPGTHGPN